MGVALVITFLVAIHIGAGILNPALPPYIQAVWLSYMAAGFHVLTKFYEGWAAAGETEKVIRKDIFIAALQWPFLKLEVGGKKIPAHLWILSWVLQGLLVAGLQWAGQKIFGVYLIGTAVYGLMLLPVVLKLCGIYSETRELFKS